MTATLILALALAHTPAEPPKSGCCGKCCCQPAKADPKPAEKVKEPEVKPAEPPGRMAEMAADRDVFHFLLTNHKDITRTVKNRDDGVETVTESDKKDVVAKIQEHAAAMHRRVKGGNGIRLRDPLFAEIFKHSDKIEMTVEKTEKGVKVTETSKDKEVVKLIQAHAEVVSKFVKDGFAEAHKNHPVPAKEEKKKARNDYRNPEESNRGNRHRRRRFLGRVVRVADVGAAQDGREHLNVRVVQAAVAA
jgi:hypothetical protein